MIIKRNAVLLTVIFALSVTVTSVSYTFYQLYQTNRAKHIDNLFDKYSLISQIYNSFLLKQISVPILEANLAVYDLYIVNDAVYKQVTRQALVLKEEGKEVSQNITFDSPYNNLIVAQVYARMLEYKGKIYFWVQSDHHSILLEDRKTQGYNPSYLFYAYGTILSILFFSFGLIIVRIAPLRKTASSNCPFWRGRYGGEISYERRR